MRLIQRPGATVWSEDEAHPAFGDIARSEYEAHPAFGPVAQTEDETHRVTRHQDAGRR